MLGLGRRAHRLAGLQAGNLLWVRVTRSRCGSTPSMRIACGGAQVQYPNALPTMMLDLGSIRRWAGFLQKTEIKFDMLSAVDELASQVP